MAPDQTIPSFFEIATGTVFDEDRWLRHHVTSEAAYDRWSPGVACLYETGLVQLILRALWRSGFPVALGWEVPYPTWPAGRLDIALYPQRTDEVVGDPHAVRHAIEVKWWLDGSKKSRLAVWSDIFKLLWFSSAKRRFILLLSARANSDLGDDIARLCSDGFPKENPPDVSLSKLSRFTEEERVWAADHFDRAEEILWAECPSPTRQWERRRLRVSLVEVHARGDLKSPPSAT